MCRDSTIPLNMNLSLKHWSCSMGRNHGPQYTHTCLLSAPGRTCLPLPSFPDFTRISILNTFLVFITFLWIYPRNFFRKLTWSNCRKIFPDSHYTVRRIESEDYLCHYVRYIYGNSPDLGIPDACHFIFWLMCLNSTK